MDNRHLRVLVIDDDAGDAALLSRHLEGVSGWRTDVTIHSNVKDGLAAIDETDPDVVFVDQYLGRDTGIAAISEIQRAGYDGPVILLTGRGDEELAVEALHCGASDYLSKAALSSASLRRSISNAMEKCSMRKALRMYHSSLEQSNHDLKRRNREVRNFYHTISHELKSPLTSAREFVSLVLEGYGGPVTDTQREYLEFAKESCDQMVRHINDLLDVARLETGKLDIQKMPERIDKIAASIVSALKPAAERQGVRLSLETTPDLPTVLIDAGRIRQVLTNLLNNGLKFTEEGGRISVKIQRQADASDILISVTDSGCGIPTEKVEQIFERLYQVSDGDSAVRGGLGLGLNIAKEIVLLHGGRIWAESKLGEGTAFHFTLPLYPIEKELDLKSKELEHENIDSRGRQEDRIGALH